MTDTAQLNTLASVSDERPVRPAQNWFGLLKPYIGSPFNAVVTFACLWLIYRLITGAWGWLVTRAIVEGVIKLSHTFDCVVVAEGLETPEQAHALLEMGCEIGQGAGISPPIAKIVSD